MKLPIHPILPAIWIRTRTRWFAALQLLLVLVLHPVTARSATFYFSNLVGIDTNIGTEELPKKSLIEAARLAVPGNTLLFHRGESWSEPLKSFNLQGKSGTATSRIYIDAYGNSADPLPIISTLDQLSNINWHRVAGTTTWFKSVDGYSDARRLYVNGASNLKVATNENDVNQPNEWYIKPDGVNGVIYINNGSTTVWPQNVEVHAVTSDTALKMKNTHYVTIQHIEFRGGSQYNVVIMEAPSTHILFDQNEVRQAATNGILATNLGTATADYVSYITVSNCTVDKVWTAIEDVPGVIVLGDGIVFQHAVENAAIVNNVVKNWAHAGIAVVAYRYGFKGVHDVVVERNKITAGESGYMHAFEVYGHEDGATDIIVRRNFCYDFTSTCHALGNGNKFYSNIFARVRLTTLSGHTPQPYGVDMAPWPADPAVPGDPTVWMVAHDNIVANNTFYDIDRFPIYLEDKAGNPIVVGQNAFYNNLIVNYGYPNNSEDIGLRVDPSVRGNTYVRYNNFWDGDASSPSTAKVARFRNTAPPYYTAVELNSLPGGYCSFNLQLDAKLQNPANNEFNLTVASPQELKTGGHRIAEVMDDGFVDYFGNAWNSTTPSIGAIQVGP